MLSSSSFNPFTLAEPNATRLANVLYQEFQANYKRDLHLDAFKQADADYSQLSLGPAFEMAVERVLLPTRWKSRVFVEAFFKVHVDLAREAQKKAAAASEPFQPHADDVLAQKYRMLLDPEVVMPYLFHPLSSLDFWNEYSTLATAVREITGPSSSTDPSRVVMNRLDAQVNQRLAGVHTAMDAVRAVLDVHDRARVQRDEILSAASPQPNPGGALTPNNSVIQQAVAASRGPIAPNTTDIQKPLRLFFAEAAAVPHPNWYFHVPVYELDGRPIPFGEFCQERLLYDSSSAQWYFQPQGRYSLTKPIPVQVSRFKACVAAGEFRWRVFLPRFFAQPDFDQTFAMLTSPEHSETLSGLHSLRKDVSPIELEKIRYESQWKTIKAKCEDIKTAMKIWDEKFGDQGLHAGDDIPDNVSVTTEENNTNDGDDELPNEAASIVSFTKSKKKTVTKKKKVPPRPKPPVLYHESNYSFETMWNVSPYKLVVRSIKAFDPLIPLWRHKRLSNGAWNLKPGDDVLVAFSGYDERTARIPDLLQNPEALADVIYALQMFRSTWCQNEPLRWEWLMGSLTYSYLYPGERTGKLPIACGVPGGARKSLQGLIYFNLVPGQNISEVFGNMIRAGFGDKAFGSPTQFLKFFFIDEYFGGDVPKSQLKHALTSKKRDREEKFGQANQQDDYTNGGAASNDVPDIEEADRRIVCLMARIDTTFNDDRLIQCIDPSTQRSANFLDLMLGFVSGFISPEDAAKYLPAELQWLVKDTREREGVGLKWSQRVMDAVKLPQYQKLTRLICEDLRETQGLQSADGQALPVPPYIRSSSAVRVHPMTEGQVIGTMKTMRRNVTMAALVEICATTMNLDTTKESHRVPHAVIPSLISGLSNNAKRMRLSTDVSAFEKNIFYFRHVVNTLEKKRVEFEVPWPVSDEDYVQVYTISKQGRWPAPGTRQTNAEHDIVYPIPLDDFIEFMDNLFYEKKVRREGAENVRRDYGHKRDVEGVFKDLRAFFKTSDDPYDRDILFYYARRGVVPWGPSLVPNANGHHPHVRRTDLMECRLLHSYGSVFHDQFLFEENLKTQCVLLPCQKKFFASVMKWMAASSQDSIFAPLDILK